MAVDRRRWVLIRRRCRYGSTTRTFLVWIRKCACADECAVADPGLGINYRKTDVEAGKGATMSEDLLRLCGPAGRRSGEN